MGVKLNTASGGSVSIEPTNTASNFTLTVPAQTGTVAINGPAFSAYATSAQTLSSGVLTKILFDTEVFDTNNNFASSRFTPTVAGYYFVSAAVGVGASTTAAVMTLFKNGSAYQEMLNLAGNVNTLCGNSPLVYCNGTTDYLEIYAQFGTGQNTYGTSQYTYFNGAMVRAA